MKRSTPQENPSGNLTRSISNFIYRIVAIAFFGAGAYYWVRLVGVYDAPLWRFDLMPLGWRVAACTFAVLYPFAGLGLWLAGSWGAVLWGLVALIEAGLVIGRPAEFSENWPIAVAHGVGLSLILLLRVADIVARRTRSRTVRRAAAPAHS
ncbi:DUF6163 family protein [Aureimonas altamirensis]|nr:DUF6163 family protein [Aureimonas altamirensis]MCM2505816.1 DUF6163 family protein [Aureimonas altamirensis]